MILFLTTSILTALYNAMRVAVKGLIKITVDYRSMIITIPIDAPEDVIDAIAGAYDTARRGVD